MNDTQFDAIVVGSGISGGWAAKELTERGLKVLVLERGKPIEHGTDYHGEHAPIWKLPYHGMPDRERDDRELPPRLRDPAASRAASEQPRGDGCQHDAHPEADSDLLGHQGDGQTRSAVAATARHGRRAADDGDGAEHDTACDFRLGARPHLHESRVYAGPSA